MPNKKLGQHFLINKSAIKKIVESLDIKPDDTIIEIGPGNGELTQELRMTDKESKIIAVEKDKILAEELRNKFFPDKNTEIIEGDILETLPSIIHKSSFKIQNYKIIGNIPYYITGKLLRIISELEKKPSLTILMTQKEVAERIAAKTTGMNLLAAAVQFWAEPKILFYLKPNEFNPPPEVDSAVIRLSDKRQASSVREKENYYKIIHVIFKQPRKTLFNNLRAGLEIGDEQIKKTLKDLKIEPNCRPQNLTLDQIKEISALANA